MHKESLAKATRNTRALPDLYTIAALAEETGVSRRFLEMEIHRGRLVALRLSTRVIRIRSVDWNDYLSRSATDGTKSG
jgi:hypothetical protein